jgi:hypothetical protein
MVRWGRYAEGAGRAESLRAALEPLLPTLLPRLFRLRFDPSADVRQVTGLSFEVMVRVPRPEGFLALTSSQAMEQLWRVAVRDPKAAVKANVSRHLLDHHPRSEQPSFPCRDLSLSWSIRLSTHLACLPQVRTLLGDLCQALTSGKWRERQAAASALADL